MISSLRGTIRKGTPGDITVDVQGVGYSVAAPLDVWDNIKEGEVMELKIVTVVREDRFDLYGFTDAASRALFRAGIAMPGIGPKLALEICSVPRHMLLMAVEQQDVKLLTSIKGVGKKTAEKLLVDLKSLMEKQPEIFAQEHGTVVNMGMTDDDAIEALRSLGYDTATILNTLKSLPEECKTSEQRVAAALRSL